MIRRSVAVLGMFLLIGAGCARPAPVATNSETPMPSPNGGADTAFAVGTWNFDAFTPAGGQAVDLSGDRAYLMLAANGELSAVLCNSIGGTYVIEGGRLTATELRSTLKFCTGASGDAEEAFTPNLETGLVIEGGGDALTLRTDDGARFALTRGEAPTTGDDEPLGANERATAGVVTAINLEQMAVDGPAKITIREEAGGTAAIHVPSFGRNLCAATEIADVGMLKVGQRVEVRGSVENADGAIVPCSSASHYFRVVLQ